MTNNHNFYLLHIWTKHSLVQEFQGGVKSRVYFQADSCVIKKTIKNDLK